MQGVLALLDFQARQEAVGTERAGLWEEAQPAEAAGSERAWIGKGFLSQTPEGVMEWEASRTKVQVWLGKEVDLPYPGGGRQSSNIPPQAAWGRTSHC